MKEILNFYEIGADMKDDMIENNHSPKRLKRYQVKVLGNAVLEKEGMEESFLSNTLNISLSGALIETSRLMPMGSLLRYCFHFPGVDKTFKLLAEVVRHDGQETAEEREGENPHGQKKPLQRTELQLYGIKFLDLTEQDRAEIACYLFH